ncbi:Hsp70 family protein [Thermosulfuriphilus sp.]
MVRYLVGIDLGTTNSAVAYVDLQEPGPRPQLRLFEIPQLTGRQRLSPHAVLPSFLYLPGEFDLEPGACALPWDKERNYIVGVLAREQGLRVPNRLVSSAKSWLCHGGVDRQSPILPWGAGDEVPKVSPVEASARYLQHIKEAWNWTMARDNPEARLENQEVIVTVPASFDDVARELTLAAAKNTGLSVTLIEEPVAAFYAWLSANEENWTEIIKEGQLILICDVGGGTTDFTLIEAIAGPEGPELKRVAVGDHILLGGDNMDLALARLVERKLSGARLDLVRFQMLTHQCREIKERLLSESGPEEEAVRLTGRGTALIAETLVAKISRDEVLSLILEEFFPFEEWSEGLKNFRSVPGGLREWGLPYARESAITKHLAAFLYRHGQKAPHFVLFNGGAMKPSLLRERILKALGQWFGSEARELKNPSLDLAICLGSAYYGLVRRGLGIKIGGGVPRSYYLGVAPKEEGKLSAVCLVPQGTEEGCELELPRSFEVITNRPVRFSLYHATDRQKDQLGEVITVQPGDLAELPPLVTVLKYGKRKEAKRIPVRVGALLTEVGTLEIFCRCLKTPHRWRLRFELRREKTAPQSLPPLPTGVVVEPTEQDRQGSLKRLPEDLRRRTEKAALALKETFSGQVPPEALPRRLREILEMEKDQWPLELLRALADTVIGLKDERKRTVAHEVRWLNLTGFFMRPGYGDRLDPWRIKQLWALHFEGLAHPRDVNCAREWWIFWRRIAGGLTSGQQNQILARIKPVLVPSRKKKGRPKIRFFREERPEMWLLAGNLERLPWQTKVDLGRALLTEIGRGLSLALGFLTLSRLGAREPLYGPINEVVPAPEVSRWILNLIERFTPPKKAGRAVLALAQALGHMGRMTGDRARDIDEETRHRLIAFLEMIPGTGVIVNLLKEARPLERTEATRLYGESLPEGLILKE